MGLGLFALTLPIAAENSLEGKIIDDSKINHSFTSIKSELGGRHYISKPDTIQTSNGDAHFIKTDSRYLLTQHILENNGGVQSHYTSDFDCDGKKDYSIIADDGTKYVYFSSEGESDPLDIKTWYIFSKDEKIIRPGYE